MGAASCVELAPKVFRLDWEKKKSVSNSRATRVTGQERGKFLKGYSTRPNRVRTGR